MIGDQALQRSPRPATDTEQQEITRIREMQEAVRQRVGTGKGASLKDMDAILGGFGPSDDAQMLLFAIHSMVQDP